MRLFILYLVDNGDKMVEEESLENRKYDKIEEIIQPTKHKEEEKKEEIIKPKSLNDLKYEIIQEIIKPKDDLIPSEESSIEKSIEENPKYKPKTLLANDYNKIEDVIKIPPMTNIHDEDLDLGEIVAQKNVFMDDDSNNINDNDNNDLLDDLYDFDDTPKLITINEVKKEEMKIPRPTDSFLIPLEDEEERKYNLIQKPFIKERKIIIDSVKNIYNKHNNDINNYSDLKKYEDEIKEDCNKNLPFNPRVEKIIYSDIIHETIEDLEKREKDNNNKKKNVIDTVIVYI